MANALYAKAKEKFAIGALDWSSDTIKCALVKNTYPENLATDEFYSDISAYVVGTPQTLGSKTYAAGVFDSADPTFTAVAAGNTLECVVVYKDTLVPGTSPLIARMDTITGWPLDTNGGDITPQWDNGAYKMWSF